jgi:murein DD-endopeptidase MepM/ murein hydrolase activator NlpD
MAAITAGAVFWLTLPLSLGGVLNRWRRRQAEAEVAMLNARRREALELATSALRQTRERLDSDRDLLARVAYLYDLHPIARRIAFAPPGGATAENALAESERQVAVLTGAVTAIEDYESRNGDAATSTPSISPVPESAIVATGGFGWRVSRITGQTEFSAGVDLAAPKGRPVSATADGVVRWTGPVSFRGPGAYFRFGKIVAIRHGGRAVTVYGNLESIAVRRGARVRRGERIGFVGDSPWFGAPRLRYEVWRLAGSDAFPMDPRLTVLTDREPGVLDALRKALKSAARAPVSLPAEFR